MMNMKYHREDGVDPQVLQVGESGSGLHMRSCRGGSQQQQGGMPSCQAKHTSTAVVVTSSRPAAGMPRLILTALVAFAMGATTQRYSQVSSSSFLAAETEESELARRRTSNHTATTNTNNTNINMVVYGHVHMAKTGGTSLNGVLAAQYERVCGHKGYSYDFVRQNQRVTELVDRGTIPHELYILNHEQDSIHTIPMRYDQYRDTFKGTPNQKQTLIKHKISNPSNPFLAKKTTTTGTTNGRRRLQQQQTIPRKRQFRTSTTQETSAYRRPITTHKQQQQRFAGYNRGRVPYQLMYEIGFHDCDWISVEDPGWWAWRDQVVPQLHPYGVSLELHVPCRDPLDHLLSQCNHKKLDFRCDLDNDNNDNNDNMMTNTEQQIDACMVLIQDRFSYHLTQLPNTHMKCYNVSHTKRYYQDYMSARLQPKRIPVDYVHRESNQKRDKSQECLLTSAPLEFQQRVLRYLRKKYDYFGFCHECMGSRDELPLASPLG